MVKGIKGGRMMKSITATKQELKELMEKGFFVRAEPVKKGDTPVYLGYNNTLSKTGPISEIWNKSGETIADVGEEFSVKNKKGEKQWFCPNCNNIVKQKKELNYYECECNGGWTDFKPPLQKGFPWKPLLVRLDKIEGKIVWENKRDGPKDCWIKTFKKVEE